MSGVHRLPRRSTADWKRWHRRVEWGRCTISEV